MEDLFDKVAFEQGPREVRGSRVFREKAFYSVASKALRPVLLVCPQTSREASVTGSGYRSKRCR